jgi:hypothetical protein
MTIQNDGSGCGGKGLNFVQREVLVDEGDGHAAFAYAAGDAFDGAVADVAGAEDAWEVGFEGEGFAVERPGGEVAAGADVALGVAFEFGGEPARVGGGADHEEECVAVAGLGELFAVGWPRGGGDAVQVVFAFDAGDLGVGFDADVLLAGDLVDEVLRHAEVQPCAADEDDDFRSVTGEEDGGLAGGVAAADEEDAFAGDAVRLVTAGAVEDAAALELGHAGDVFQAMPVDAGGQQDGTGCDEVAAVELDAVAVVSRFEGFDVA